MAQFGLAGGAGRLPGGEGGEYRICWGSVTRVEGRTTAGFIEGPV